MLTEDGDVKHRPGSRLRRWLDFEQEAHLRKFVAENGPTLEEAIAFVEESWGATYSRTGMRNTLLRIGAFLPFGRARGLAQRWTLEETPDAPPRPIRARRVKLPASGVGGAAPRR
jgi:hypothetical protein